MRRGVSAFLQLTLGTNICTRYIIHLGATQLPTLKHELSGDGGASLASLVLELIMGPYQRQM